MMERMGGRVTKILAKVILFLVKCLFMIISVGPIPDHVAFIMDGNRRYAKKLNMATEFGHKAGYFTLMKLLVFCYELGVKHVTVYAFSIENFKRQSNEVHYLMDLMTEKIEGMLDKESIANRFDIRVCFVGDLKLLDERVRVAAEKVARETANKEKTVLSVCLAYTSRDEITNAVREACIEKRDEIKAPLGQTKLSSGIKLVDVEKHMYMSLSPDPDIVIRSSGEMRLSNFLLWQTSYCPLYSPEALWPELGLWHLLWAVLNFQRSYNYLEKKKKKI